MQTTVPLYGFGGVSSAAVRAAASRNLLDNSDFLHFVAQAGVGGTHGAQAYAGDRWILVSGSVTGEANANGDGYTAITLDGTIRQVVANPPDVATVCMEMVSGTADISYEGGAVTISSAGGVLKNAALYEGTYTAVTMPEYRAAGYAAELLTAQAYYRRMSAEAGMPYAGIVSSSAKKAIINIGTAMRINPTVVTSSDFAVVCRTIGGYSDVTGSGGVAPSSIYSMTVGNSISLHIMFSATLTTNNTPAGVTIIHGYLDLCADLEEVQE